MKFYIKLFSIHIFSIIIFLILSDIFIDDTPQTSLEVNFKDYPILFSIFIVVLAPLFEEFIFRFPLKFSYLNIFVIPLLIICFLNTYVFLVKLSIVLYIISLIIQRFFLKKNYIYITSLLCFTTIHLDNYDSLDNLKLFHTISLIFPQFLLAIILSFVRVKSNLKGSIIYHSAYNFIILLLAIIYLFYE
ncbi:CPBP family glutamic-type intramembrane protease [Myroides sp. LJL116]